MSKRSIAAAAASLVGVLALGLAGERQALGQGATAATTEPMPKFDAAYLNNAANIKLGEGVWTQQCRHCHGASAYPGKAPKLRPAGLEPEFMFDRVSNGFRAMPAWSAVFSLEQRKAVVAYMKSSDFSP